MAYFKILSQHMPGQRNVSHNNQQPCIINTLTCLKTATKHIKLRSCRYCSIFHKVNTHSSRKNIGSMEGLTKHNNATFGSLTMGKKISRLPVQNIKQHNRKHKSGRYKALHGNYLSFTAHSFPRQPPQQSCTLPKGFYDSLLVSES